jgi:hypothetical protein
MYNYGETSTENILSAHPKLQLIAHHAINMIDISCTCGVRTELEQQKLFDKGLSKTLKSKHLPHEYIVTYQDVMILKEIYPKRKLVLQPGDVAEWSRAIDLQPYPMDWRAMNNDNPEMIKRFSFMCGIVKGIAYAHKIPVRMGIDWNGNGKFTDQTFHDLPHIELL